ncbi:MAG: tetratricopeptide repeat protein [Nitrospiraceae bacterium]|nr:MAG: tetratricopeptide repeat protein [Nitrospiraceae bacterium]
MPKTIKKKPAKKKPAEAEEVKHVALQALDLMKKRQRQVIIIVSVIAVAALLLTAFRFYSSSQTGKAYAVEREADDVYYAAGKDKALPATERWKKALDLYKKSIDIKATPTALFNLGNCYYNLGDYDNAIKQYNVFVNKFGSNREILPLVYQKLASAYFKSGKNDKALEATGNLAKVGGGAFKDTALLLEARYYDSAGNTAQALEKYRALVSEFPASTWSAEAGEKIARMTKQNNAGSTEQKPAGGPASK